MPLSCVHTARPMRSTPILKFRQALVAEVAPYARQVVCRSLSLLTRSKSFRPPTPPLPKEDRYLCGTQVVRIHSLQQTTSIISGSDATKSCYSTSYPPSIIDRTSDLGLHVLPMHRISLPKRRPFYLSLLDSLRRFRTKIANVLGCFA